MTVSNSSRTVTDGPSCSDRMGLMDWELDFHTLANSMPQLAWMTDANGYIFWYNQRIFDYTGSTLEEMQGSGWKKLHHPDILERATESFQAPIAAWKTWEDTFPLRGKDGEYRWFLSRALPIRDAEGHVVRWFGTNTDITEQRETEQLTKRHAEALNRISQASSDHYFGAERIRERRRQISPAQRKALPRPS